MQPSLLFGAAMASVDVVILSILKALNLGWIKGAVWMIFSAAIYALQPFMFLKSLQFESLTVMNLMWDMMSDVLVTIIGLWYFKEQLTVKKLCGVGLSFVSIYLLCC